MMDDESGLVHYREEMRELWDGTWRHSKNLEFRHPQEFVKAERDPRALRHTRDTQPCAAVSNQAPVFVGTGDALSPTGPGSRLGVFQQCVLVDEDGRVLVTESNNPLSAK